MDVVRDSRKFSGQRHIGRIAQLSCFYSLLVLLNLFSSSFRSRERISVFFIFVHENNTAGESVALLE